MAKKQRTEEAEEQAQEGGNVFTYIGQGETPPRKINFMGLQEFVRGRPVTVENPDVLAKLENHPCFVRGEIEEIEEALHAQDTEATKEADQQRAEDARADSIFKKMQKRLAPKGEEE